MTTTADFLEHYAQFAEQHPLDALALKMVIYAGTGAGLPEAEFNAAIPRAAHLQGADCRVFEMLGVLLRVPRSRRDTQGRFRKVPSDFEWYTELFAIMKGLPECASADEQASIDYWIALCAKAGEQP